MKYLIITIGVLLLFFSMRPSKIDKEPLTSGDTILALGDSLTYGFGAKAEESYPSVLEAMTGYRVINAGVNGETSDEIRRRLPALLEHYRPRVTILCAGGNDILQKKSMDALKANLEAMITTIKASGSDVLLVAVPHVTLFGLNTLPLYEEVAEQTDTPLLEGVLADILEQPGLKSDYIHPNAKGYRQMAEAVREKLHTLYND